MKDHNDMNWHCHQALLVAKMAEEEFGVILNGPEINALVFEIYRQINSAKVRSTFRTTLEPNG